jgi:hypothetical protein
MNTGALRSISPVNDAPEAVGFSIVPCERGGWSPPVADVSTLRATPLDAPEAHRVAATKPADGKRLPRR